MSGPRPLVAVIGGASCTDDQAVQAERVGKLLAQEGAVVICGGRGGIMEAACKGAHEAGGLTIGILPGHDLSGANPYLGVAVPTGLGDARNTVVAQAASVVIAIGGGYGTLSEIALARKAGVPVVGMGTWDATDATGQPVGIITADQPEHAVRLALAHAESDDG